MKILVITSTIQDSNSTASIHTREISQNLSKEHRVLVIAQTEYRIAEDSNLSVKKIRVPRLGSSNILSSIVQKGLVAMLTFLAAIQVLTARSLTAFKPDVIYARHGVNSVGTVLLSQLFNVPLVFEVNTLFQEEATKLYAWGKVKIIVLLTKALDLLSFRCASRIVAVTPGIKKGIRESGIPAGRIAVVPNGANVQLFVPMDQRAVRNELGFSHRDKVVCFVGSAHQIAPWFGVEYLLESAPLVLNRVPEARFLIVGNIGLRKELLEILGRLALGNKFILAGEVDYEDVPKYINASDVCVAPFGRALNEKTDLSPLKLYEYLACEKPVVGSDIKGVGDFLESSQAGISVEAENSPQLANAIVFLLMKKETRELMGKRGRQIVVKNYSWRSAAEKIAIVCKEAVNCRAL
jgi:glycosyltransferase involved in cell wall biosynthesis